MATPTSAVLVTILVVGVVTLVPSGDAAPGRGQGCVFEGVVHAQGSQVVTEEPCLNCTCLRGALICHLKVCPDLPDPPPRGCILLHRKDECCPKLVCHKNGVKQLTGVNESTHEAPLEELKNGSGCVVNGTAYAEGSAMASSSLCEYCYCIRGKQQCVEPKCLLHLLGCNPLYTTHSCCPTSYNCSPSMPHSPDGTTIATTTTTTMASRKTHGCTVGGERYDEGTLVSSVASSDCENCFCVKGKVRCMSLAFAPPLQGCSPIVKKGECWPASYNCSGTTMNLQLTETDFILKNVVGDRKLPNSVRSMPVIPATATHNTRSSSSGFTVEGRANNKLMNISQKNNSANQTIITTVEKSEPSKEKNINSTIQKTNNVNLTEITSSATTDDTNTTSTEQEYAVTENDATFSTEPTEAETNSTNAVSQAHASENNASTAKVQVTSTEKPLKKTNTKLSDSKKTTQFITSTIATTLSTIKKPIKNPNTTSNKNTTHSSSTSTSSIINKTLPKNKTTPPHVNTTLSPPRTTARSGMNTTLSAINTTPSIITTISTTSPTPSMNTTLADANSTKSNKHTTTSDTNTTQSIINTTPSNTNKTHSNTNTTIKNTNTTTLTDDNTTQSVISNATLSDSSTPQTVINVTHTDNDTSVSNRTGTTVPDKENSTSPTALDTTEITGSTTATTASEISTTITDNTTNPQERIDAVEDPKKTVTESPETETDKSTEASNVEDKTKDTFSENKLITADGTTESLEDILLTTDTTTIVMPDDLLVVNITMHSNLSIRENNKTEAIVTASPPPSRSIPPEVEAVLNVTNKKDDDYEYDYNEPSLPPSLPNLRIIPFVAADAVLESMEKGNPTIYPIPEKLRPTDSPIFYKASHPNLFSPPIETEGGFLPREPIIDGPFYESKFDLTYHTTNKNMPGDHLSLDITASTVTPQSITVPPKSKDDNCLSDGRDYHHGELLSKPDACIMCVCYFGEIHCHPPKCPTVKTGCRRVKEIDHSSCCGRIVCDEEESPTVVLDRIDVTLNPLQSPLLGGIVPPITVAEGVVTPDPFRDVIRTEAAPDLPSLIGNMNPYLLERHSPTYSTSTSPFPSLWSWTNLSSAEQPSTSTTPPTQSTTRNATDPPASVTPPKTTERHTSTPVYNATTATKLTSSSPVYQSNAPTSTRVASPIEFTTLTPQEEKEEYTEDFEKEDDDSFSLDSVFKLLFSGDEQTTSRPRTTRRPPTPAHAPADDIPSQHINSQPESIDRIDENIGQTDHNHSTHLLEHVNLSGGDNDGSNDLPQFRPDIVLSESPPGRPLLGDPVAASGLLKLAGCNIYGRMYRVGRIISELSGPCLECMCTEIGVQCRKLSC